MLAMIELVTGIVLIVILQLCFADVSIKSQKNAQIAMQNLIFNRKNLISRSYKNYGAYLGGKKFFIEHEGQKAFDKFVKRHKDKFGPYAEWNMNEERWKEWEEVKAQYIKWNMESLLYI